MAEKRLKIAFLSFYSGEVSRGVETYVHELSNKLSQNGHSITVYQNGPRRKGSDYETVSIGLAIDWAQKGGGRGMLGIPFTQYYARLVGRFTRRALAKINSSKVDVLITTNGSLQVLFARVWCWISGVKLVVAGQSGPGFDDRWNLLCFPNVFVGMTEYHCAWAKKANPLVKVKKIPNGVDLQRFSRRGKVTKFNLPKPVVFVAAALEKGKRLDLLIKAMGQTEKGSLLIAGGGDLEQKLKRLGKKYLGKRFQIKRFEYEQMPSVYRSVDLFSYPTVPWESFGIVMLEAMASGLSVVATNDPIRKEIVGDAGILVDPTDTDAYANALQKALNMNWGSRPRKQAEKFSWDKTAQKYEKMFLELLNK